MKVLQQAVDGRIRVYDETDAEGVMSGSRRKAFRQATVAKSLQVVAPKAQYNQL